MNPTSPTPCPSCAEAAKEIGRLRSEADTACVVSCQQEARAERAESALAEVMRERDHFKGVLMTESNERIRCRDGWSLEAQRSEAALARVVALEGALTDLFRWGVTHDANDTAAWEAARALLPGGKP